MFESHGTVGKICSNLVIGNIYLWGSIILYISSYFKDLGYNQALSFYLLFVPIERLAEILGGGILTLAEPYYGIKM